MNVHQVLEKIASLLFSVLLSLLVTNLDLLKQPLTDQYEFDPDHVLPATVFIMKKQTSCSNGDQPEQIGSI